MIILGADAETTGLNVNTDRIIELGLVLWDTEKKKPLRIFNELLWDDSCPALQPVITEKTGITQEDLRLYGVRPISVFCHFREMLKQAEAIVGHNLREFDKRIISQECNRSGLPSIEEEILAVDTMLDLPFPEDITARKLVHVCADHGILNPYPHRALFDVLSTLQLFGKYPLETVLGLAREESVILIAMVEFQDKDKAKDRKFRWDGERKLWQKRVKASQVEGEQNACGFMCERQQDDGRRI